MYPTLTKKQKEILDYIKISSQMNGYAPSLSEIKEHFRLSAISTVHEHIQNLKNKGLLHKEINQARSIRAVEFDLHGNEVSEVPVTTILSRELKLKILKKVEILAMHKSMLQEMGKYFAVVVDTDRFHTIMLNKGDFLIIKEQATVNDGDVCLFSPDNNRYDLARLYKDQAGYLAKPVYTEENSRVFKKLTVAGVVVCLLRKFTRN